MSALPIVLEAVGLSRQYRLGRGLFAPPVVLKAVDGVGFTLAAGKILAVVGESGCGKSTLGRLATLIEPPTSGTLRLAGIEATTRDAAQRRALRQSVQMVFQDPYGSLNPRKKVGSIIGEPLRINGKLSVAEIAEAVRAMMARVGLRPEHYNRYPHMFSGGQRQRIAIARALMLNPKVVVADEPVSSLDVSIQAQVLNLMMDLRDQFDLAYLFISHDLGVVRHLADDVLVMYLGRPAEQGAKEAVFARPRHPYTRALMSATPRVDPALRTRREAIRGEPPSPFNPPLGCAFHNRCPLADSRCAVERPDLRPVDGRLVACHHAESAVG